MNRSQNIQKTVDTAKKWQYSRKKFKYMKRNTFDAMLKFTYTNALQYTFLYYSM